jgi:hypothetical protein
MGKTSLLLHFRDQLLAAGWLVPSIQEFDTRRSLSVIWPQLRSDLEAMSPQALPKLPRREWQHGDLRWKTGAELGTTGPKLTAEVEGSLAPVSARAAAGEELRIDILRFLVSVFDSGVALALLFDEAQDANRQDLGLLAELGHKAGQERWPLLLIFAGLTPLHDKLVRARSYATRFTAVPVGPLEEHGANEALDVPARQREVEFDPSALVEAVSFASGVPYHLQMIGQHAWERKRDRRIMAAAVVDAVPVAKAEIEHAMYRPLWNRASEAEQEYLMAMMRTQRTHHGIPVAAVLRTLGRDHSTGATLRARLVSKGLIHPLRYGQLEFSYPGFAEFLAAQGPPSPRPDKTRAKQQIRVREEDAEDPAAIH